jgi:hypothetical protein
MAVIQSVTCPVCDESFELAEAYRQVVAEDVVARERAVHRAEIETLRSSIEQRTRQALGEQFAVELHNAHAEANEQRTMNKDLRQTLIDLNAQLRKLSAEREADSLNTEKLLREQTEVIRTEERERAYETHRLKQLETEAKLKQAQDSVERMRMQLEQGSQQTQGEVLELDLADQLRELFPDDDIALIKKGQRGADVRQVVRTPLGQGCGTILWEAKNAQWQPNWIGKLKSDMRDAAADHAVLISVHTPDAIGPLGHVEGTVWAARPKLAASLGTMLRQWLLHSLMLNGLNVSKDQRMEALYQYVTSAEFRGRVEAIRDAYRALQDELEKEKRWFAQKWAREEKYIRGVLDNALGLYGDFEGVNGCSLQALGAGGPVEITS